MVGKLRFQAPGTAAGIRTPEAVGGRLGVKEDRDGRSVEQLTLRVSRILTDSGRTAGENIGRITVSKAVSKSGVSFRLDGAAH